MRILCLDDEALALNTLVKAVTKATAGKNAEIEICSSSTEALELAKEKPFDIVFSDINMPGLHGIDLAKALKKTNPKVNIIFVTGYDNYKDDAIKLHVSGYIKKPVMAEDVTEEMENLLHPTTAIQDDIYIQTFGNFDVFVNGKPLNFHRNKSKELLAYLVDRHGGLASRKESAGILFEDSDFDKNEQIYLSNIAADLQKDLEVQGAGKILNKRYNGYSVNMGTFECDSYAYLQGNTDAINQFRGEYLEQYSWAEYYKSKFFN